ncbi:MAG: AAA family ATPase [Candidatus Micrarchaeota archaeon]|nr:AAA family ATPase [Candidatus Micrarchaeota archaeon]MDE1824311.1 AAA family ATPase [Candidatus Micrarchaeota archaeon]MDE1849742.1 AAA family ATPase [Candidatus Micrarchaeota archaeon]
MKAIIITGTPATGKSRIAGIISKRIRDSELIRANDIVNEKRLFSSVERDGTKVVKMRALKNEIEKRMKESKRKLVIVEGHLLCDMRISGATAIVMREHLGKLIGRMRKRGYSSGKIRDNIVSEATDYCGANASANYKKSFEVMNDSRAIARIMNIVKGRYPKARSIDLLGELNDVAMRNRKYAF